MSAEAFEIKVSALFLRKSKSAAVLQFLYGCKTFFEVADNIVDMLGSD